MILPLIDLRSVGSVGDMSGCCMINRNNKTTSSSCLREVNIMSSKGYPRTNEDRTLLYQGSIPTH